MVAIAGYTARESAPAGASILLFYCYFVEKLREKNMAPPKGHYL
jgi:hypothetical protein